MRQSKIFQLFRIWACADAVRVLPHLAKGKPLRLFFVVDRALFKVVIDLLLAKALELGNPKLFLIFHRLKSLAKQGRMPTVSRPGGA